MIILYRLDVGTLGLMTLPRYWCGEGEGNQMVVEQIESKHIDSASQKSKKLDP